MIRVSTVGLRSVVECIFGFGWVEEEEVKPVACCTLVIV